MRKEYTTQGAGPYQILRRDPAVGLVHVLTLLDKKAAKEMAYLLNESSHYRQAFIDENQESPVPSDAGLSQASLARIEALCGIPDPKEACRLILKEVESMRKNS